MTVTKTKDGPVFRVTDSGKPAMHGRLPVDGGGFFDEGSADKLARDINDRQERASKTTVTPMTGEGLAPPVEHYGGVPVEPIEPIVMEGLAPPVAHYGGHPLPEGELPPVPPGMTIAPPPEPPPEGQMTKQSLSSAAAEEYEYDDSDEDDDDEPDKPASRTTKRKIARKR